LARYQYDGRALVEGETEEEKEEEKLRTVILSGSDEILVICSGNGHGSLRGLGELASWIPG
jgi:hypothetical protein